MLEVQDTILVLAFRHAIYTDEKYIEDVVKATLWDLN